MDRFGTEKKPLLVLKIRNAPKIFGSYFKIFKCLMPKQLGYSWNLMDGFSNMGSGSWRFPIFFLETHWHGVKLYWRHAN